LLYQDILIALDADRGIHNGQPTLHAQCLAACAVRAGEAVIHLGAGTGYYTAVLAHLVGAQGRVAAFEIETDLARRAGQNLSRYPNVSVSERSGAGTALPVSDVIYVSAGATHPLPEWLDALNIGGRLLFPMTPEQGLGFMLRVTRVTDDAYEASAITGAAFIGCAGARNTAAATALATALENKPSDAIRSLHRNGAPDASGWLVGDDWWLSTTPPDQAARRG
jgi:protein-L-isoaspartate(D-aspartate) O-methyltransferase